MIYMMTMTLIVAMWGFYSLHIMKRLGVETRTWKIATPWLAITLMPLPTIIAILFFMANAQ